MSKTRRGKAPAVRVRWREYVKNADLYDERREAGMRVILTDDEGRRRVMTLQPISHRRFARHSIRRT